MLTVSIKGRVLDYSRVVGGRVFRGITYATLGDENDVFIVTRDTYGSEIIKITIGLEIDDEEEVVSFSKVNKGIFDHSWPTCAAFNNGKLYVTDELKNCVTVFDSEGNFIVHLLY